MFFVRWMWRSRWSKERSRASSGGPDVNSSQAAMLELAMVTWMAGLTKCVWKMALQGGEHDGAEGVASVSLI